MSRWLQRHPQPKSQHASQPQSQSIPSSSFAPGRTAYISTNTAEQKAFYTDAPTGSQHAARLQKLALQQQPEYRPPEPDAAKMPERNVQRSITAAQGEPLGCNDGDGIASPNAPAQTGRRRRNDAMVLTCPECAAQSARPPTHRHTQAPPYSSSSSGSSPNPSPKPTRVHRYERDGTISYHKKAAGAELLISAPAGSQKAKGMDDAVAGSLAAQAAYPTGYVRIQNAKQ